MRKKADIDNVPVVTTGTIAGPQAVVVVSDDRLVVKRIHRGRVLVDEIDLHALTERFAIPGAAEVRPLQKNVPLKNQ